MIWGANVLIYFVLALCLLHDKDSHVDIDLSDYAGKRIAISCWKNDDFNHADKVKPFVIARVEMGTENQDQVGFSGLGYLLGLGLLGTGTHSSLKT